MHESYSPPYLAFLTNPTGDTAIDNDLQYIRDLDWDGSSIGPIATWPKELLVLVNLALLSPQPQLFLLGHDSRILYNTAYARLLRDHHPIYQGRPINLNTALIAQAPAIDRIVQSAKSRSRPANENDVPFFFLNNGQLEEVFLSATMVHLPLSLNGYHATTYDTTTTVLHTCREQSLRDIRHACEKAMNLDSLWISLCDGISKADMDISFAVIYHAESRIKQDEDTGYLLKQVETGRFELAGTVGAFQTTPKAKLERFSDQPWTEKIFEAIEGAAFELLDVKDATLPEEMCRASRDRCYGDDCRTAVVVPSTSEADTLPAVLILGLAPRRPYNAAYQTWIQTLHHTFAYHVARLSMLEDKAIAKANDETRDARARNVMAKEILVKRKEAALATGKVQRMFEIMETASVGIFECTSSGIITQCNQAFRKMSGDGDRLQADIFSKMQDFCEPKRTLTPDEDLGVSIAARPTTFSIGLFHASKKNHQWVQITCVPELNDTNEVIAISGCMTNIDAQKELEHEADRNRAVALRQLYLSETRLSNFIENAPFGILIMDQMGSTFFVNKTWFQLTGHVVLPAHEVDLRSVVHPKDLPKVNEYLGNISSISHSDVLHVRLNQLWAGGSKDIRHTWVQFTAFLETTDGKNRQITTTFTDISGFKYSEVLHHARLEEAMEAKRQQENFVDMTSHEIRNPLSAVMHSTDALLNLVSECKSLLERPVDEESFHQLRVMNAEMLGFLDAIHSCTTHQRRIADDILALSKLDSGLLAITPATFHLETFVRQIERIFGPEAKKDEIEFTACVDVSVNSLEVEWIKADSGRIMQVLVNLITNSLKFTKDSKGPRKVEVRLGADTSASHRVFANLTMVGEAPPTDTVDKASGADDVFLWCSVVDTGCGMDAKGRARIFSRFGQASPKTYNKYGGSGIGLVVSRKLVELQAGRIGFTSKEGAGSTFAFSAKASRCSSRKLTSSCEADKRTIRIAKRPMRALPRAAGSGSHLNILLVEDNLINQRVLKLVLQRHGFPVHTSDNGLEALKYLKTTQCWKDCKNTSRTRPIVDLILMDIEMPIMDGLECARTIRAAELDGSIDRHLHIIAITANARAEQLKEALDAGMDGTMVKPFRMTDLEPILKRLGATLCEEEVSKRLAP